MSTPAPGGMVAAPRQAHDHAVKLHCDKRQIPMTSRSPAQIGLPSLNRAFIRCTSCSLAFQPLVGQARYRTVKRLEQSGTVPLPHFLPRSRIGQRHARHGYCGANCCRRIDARDRHRR